MNTQHVLVETLTPLHIGSGRMLQGNTEYLYFSDTRAVAVVDERKILDIIGEENIDTWIGIISRGDNLLDYLNKRKPGVQPSATSRRLLSVLGQRSPGGNQTIREQIFSGNGQPILPGSSLKGAIRTAVLNALIRQNPAPARDIRSFKRVEEREDFRTGRLKRVVKYQGGTLEKKYTGQDPNHDVFRLLRIGDAHFEQTICLLSETLNELAGSRFEMKESVKQFIECIPAGAQTICRVQIPAELKARLNETQYREVAAKIPHRDRMEWPLLLTDINNNTKRLVQNELNRYQSQNLPGGANEYLDSLKGMITNLPKNQCIIRVGFGTGYLNMTGGWAEEQWKAVLPKDKFDAEMLDLSQAVRHDQRGSYDLWSQVLPKSRKMALGGIPLGFLKLTVFSESEFLEWQSKATERQAEQIHKAGLIRAQLEQQAAQREAERLAQEAEAQRLAEEQRIAQEIERRKPYDGKLKKGVFVNAEVVAVSGAKATLKLYVMNHDNDRFQITYNGLKVGDLLVVEVKDVSGKGKISAVGFKSR